MDNKKFKKWETNDSYQDSSSSVVLVAKNKRKKGHASKYYSWYCQVKGTTFNDIKY